MVQISSSIDFQDKKKIYHDKYQTQHEGMMCVPPQRLSTSALHQQKL